jgi:hypothetical protein
VNGTLEDLCLDILSEQGASPLLENIDSFIELLKKQRARKFPHLHRSRLHCYLSITDDYVAMKIGEAAQAGAFDFHHEKLKPLTAFLREMTSG